MAIESELLLPFLAGMTLVLAVAHTLGTVADRLGFAPVVGELLTGLVLGPSILGVVAPTVTSIVVPVPDRLAALASLGLILLLVLAGTEVDVQTVRRYVRPTIALATGASVVPFLLGFTLGWVLPARFLVTPEQRLPFALFLATALSISAVPVAVRVLIDLDAMDRTVGQLTLTVAVVIDAAGWVALTIVSDIARVGQIDPLGLGRTLLVLAVFVGVTLVFGPRIVDTLFDVTAYVRSPALTGFSIVIVVGLAMAGGSLALGLEAVLGAFLAGVLVRNRLGTETERVFQMVTLGLFAPIFFATAGLRVDLSGLLTLDTLLVAGVTLAVAVLGKALGVVLGATFTDLSRAETVCLAIGLNARGAMELVVAALGLAIGILTPTIYAVVVFVAIVTSIMTPPLLRRALAHLPDDVPAGTV
ncbi:Kef-type K+ transport system, membrane component KefB [Halogranum amylolyticum]|uniref:Kef-type K+ transport system, membrane component KefB n=1 Tax=Halogranum amylolyticum TaxID=660520 RepID=A0A1H8VS26_9EURY|nr:cation:proton antiporter [Halogranum amylolyticum]SEP18229.1 Kef-type K+ transport system, membrane component KefB [Halogranum amylolyticum]